MAENKELATALKQAKTTPMHFAFVSKGAEGELLANKKKVPAKEVNEAKQASGGKAVFRGRMFWEDGTMVFELAKEPPSTLAKALKKAIKDSAGMTMAVETRVNAALEADEEGGEAETEGTPTDTDAKDGATVYAARLKALAPAIQKVVETPMGKDVQAQIGEANKLYIAKQYDPANAALDKVEDLIKKALATQTSQASGTDGLNGALADWQKVRTDVIAQLRKLSAEVAATKHPRATKALLEINSVLSNLTASPATMAKVLELERYLSLDDVVFDVCDLSFDLRTPLLKSLTVLKAKVPQ